MVSSGMLRRVALVRTDVSEEYSASFIRLTRIGEPSKLFTDKLNIPKEKTLLYSLLPASGVLLDKSVLQSCILFPQNKSK
jgi:hypothetical protein